MKMKQQIFPVGAIIAAAWFLFNPNISTIDLLPDCIAYALMLFALRHLTAFVPYMREAHEGFRKLFYLSLIKIPATFVMMIMASERVTILLFSASFAILELIFLIPAITNFFEGLFYMGQRFGCHAAIRAERNGEPDSIRTMTYLFVSIKAALSTLPDFSLLFTYDPLTGKGFSVTNVQYAFILLIAFLVALVIGILWLTHVLPYFRALAKDEGVLALVPPDSADLSKQENRRLQFSLPFFLFATAVSLSVDIVIDDISILPDYLSATVFLALAVFFFVCDGRKGPLSLIISSAYLAATILFSVFRSRFYASYTESDLTRLPSADAAYRPVLILSIIAELLFLVTLYLLAKRLYRFYRAGTHTEEPTDDYERRLLKEEAGRQKKLHICGAVFAILSSLTTVLHLFLLRKTVRLDLQPDYGGGSLYLPASGTSWLWPLLFSLCLSVLTVWLSSERTHELWRRHELEDDTSSYDRE